MFRLAIFLLIVLTQMGAANAAKRAFVVGNGRYLDASELPNPANDAADLAAKLTGLGYQVTLGLDLERAKFLTSFQKFERELQQDDIALLFYAGHGIQIGGENYLFPTDAVVREADDARKELISLNALIAGLSRRAKTQIVILDACRNNPFAPKIERALKVRAGGVSRGLARVYAGVGSFIAFSTQPGNVAADGSGRNSPFATALLRHVDSPGIDVHAVMRSVRAEVRQNSDGQQIPWESSSLIEEVAFAAPGTTEARPVPPATSAPSPATRYHYVGGLDPNGDNFLALKAGPDLKSSRLAMMGPGTLLTVTGERGSWKQVLLRDGATGWAHRNWIKCCRTIGGDRQHREQKDCEQLWHERNAIWHRYGYCFRGARGQQVFGNAGCYRDLEQAQAALSAADQATVATLLAQEKQLGCR